MLAVLVHAETDFPSHSLQGIYGGVSTGPEKLVQISFPFQTTRHIVRVSHYHGKSQFHAGGQRDPAT